MTRETPGITAPVEIIRNNANIPHIMGENDSDVFFGLGYVHAQDRLWQMMIMRRTVQGRLSEMFGPRTLKTDELMRRLDLYTLARGSLQYQNEDTKAALSAYASGVNAYLARVNSEALGRGAPEFFLFSNEISPWQPVDSLAILKLMGRATGRSIGRGSPARPCLACSARGSRARYPARHAGNRRRRTAGIRSIV